MLRESRTMKKAIPPKSRTHTTAIGTTTPVDMLLEAEDVAVVAVVAVLASSSSPLPVRLENASEEPSPPVDAPAAALFWAPALVPALAPLWDFASASCTALSRAALLSAVLLPVAAIAVVPAGPAKHRAASTAINDMCEVIRRIALETAGEQRE